MGNRKALDHRVRAFAAGAGDDVPAATVDDGDVRSVGAAQRHGLTQQVDVLVVRPRGNLDLVAGVRIVYRCLDRRMKRALGDVVDRLTLVRNAVAVDIVARAGRNVALIGYVVFVAVLAGAVVKVAEVRRAALVAVLAASGLTLIGYRVLVTVLAGAVVDVAEVGRAVPVAVFQASGLALVGDAAHVAVLARAEEQVTQVGDTVDVAVFQAAGLTLVRHPVGVTVFAGAVGNVPVIRQAILVAVRPAEFVTTHVDDWRVTGTGVRRKRVVHEARVPIQIQWYGLRRVPVTVEIMRIGRDGGVITCVDAR